MATQIDDYRCLDISKLKKWGYLTPDPNTDIKTGVLSWERMGETIAEITIGARMAGASPAIVLIYSYNGKPKIYKIKLQFVPSNLPNRGNTGYYYFVCPLTGEYCRKLYLYKGTFVSRKAFRPLYWNQAMSHKQRKFESPLDWLLLPSLMEKEMGSSAHRKTTYRGKLTPYGRKAERWNAKLRKYPMPNI